MRAAVPGETKSAGRIRRGGAATRACDFGSAGPEARHLSGREFTPRQFLDEVSPLSLRGNSARVRALAMRTALSLATSLLLAAAARAPEQPAPARPPATA